MIARRSAVAIAALVLTTLASTAPAHAESSDIVNADISMRLAKDSSLLVIEQLTFDYKGHFEGSYRDIIFRHGEEISNVVVSENGRRYEPGGDTTLGSFDFAGRYGVQPIASGTRIVWHYRATDELRTFEVSYRVRRAVAAYDDVLDVGWTVWGDQWDFDLDQLTASVTDPGLDPADQSYRVWGHPRSVEGETVRGEGIATLEAADINSGTAVEMRVTIPRSPARSIAGARAIAGDGLEEILGQERELDENFNSAFNRAKRWIADHALLLSLALAALAALGLAICDLLARERRASAPEYLAEPPDDTGPALAYSLAHEGGDSDDTVLATLLDLVDRGFYATATATTEKEKLDLTLSAADDRPATDGLAEHERDVLGFFDQLLDGQAVAISEMKDKIPAHSELWRGRWERMTAKLNDIERGELEWDRELNGARWMLAVVLAVGFAVVSLADSSVNDRFPLAAVAGAVVLIAVASYPRTRLKRLAAAHGERKAKWRAFAHWTKDFPRLADDPPATLELWKRILVYGVAFGTAERMIASGRIPEPVAASASSGNHWSSFVFVGSFDGNAFDGSTFSSGFASQVSPPASSGGGGGGFSGGGGGGFSGGGGGGSW